MHSRTDRDDVRYDNVSEREIRGGISRSERFEPLKFMNRVERYFRKRDLALGLDDRNHHIVGYLFICDRGYIADKSVKIFSCERQPRRQDLLVGDERAGKRRPSREERGYTAARGKKYTKDDWMKFLHPDKAPAATRGELVGDEPDFSEEGWARRRPKKK